MSYFHAVTDLREQRTGFYIGPMVAGYPIRRVYLLLREGGGTLVGLTSGDACDCWQSCCAAMVHRDCKEGPG